MFPLLATIICWVPSLLGLGAALCRWLGPEEAWAPSLGEMALVGLAALSLIGHLIHFGFPLQSFPVLAFGMGLLLFAFQIRALKKKATPAALLFFLAAPAIAYLSSKNFPGADTGMYHLPSIQWNLSEPLPLGLVNLYFPLGYNSSWFVVGAMFSLPWLGLSAPFALNSLLTVCFIVAVAESLSRHARIIGRPTLSGLYYFFCLPTLFLTSRHLLVYPLGNPDPDLAVALYGLLAFYLLARALEGYGTAWSLRLALLCGAFSATIKTTGIPLFAAEVFFSFLLIGLRQEGPIGQGTRARHLLKIIVREKKLLGFVTLLLGTWSLRGIFLSGCLAFPVPMSCFSSLPWSPSAETWSSTLEQLRFWNFGPEYIKGVPSLVSWTRQNLFAIVSANPLRNVLILSALATLISIGKIFRKGFPDSHRRQIRVFWGLLPVVVAGNLFWYVNAPNARFGYTWVYSLPLLLLAIGFLSGRLGTAFTRWGPWIPVATVLFLFPLGYTDPLRPPADWAQWPRVPTRTAIPNRTPAGESYLTPNNGWQCWDLPVPCTPYYSPKLHRETWKGHTVFLLKGNQE